MAGIRFHQGHEGWSLEMTWHFSQLRVSEEPTIKSASSALPPDSPHYEDYYISCKATSPDDVGTGPRSYYLLKDGKWHSITDGEYGYFTMRADARAVLMKALQM
jgi:hypothetical protein